MSTSRLHRRATPRLFGLAVALAALAATALNPTANAGARGTTPPAKGIQPIVLPGMHAPSYTVTLVTGDQVRLAGVGSGRYNVTADPQAGARAAINISARGGPHGTSSATAIPATAQALITSGALDRSLFDVPYLATHGDSGPAAHIPVTIQYARPQTTATLAGKAAALPGATVAATHPATGTIDLTVAAANATAFWAALTGEPATADVYSPGPARPKLAGGAIRAWPTGHRTAAPRPRASAQALYQVTETVKRGTGGCENSGYTLFLLTPTLSLTAVTGSGAGNVYAPDSVSCADNNPGTTDRITYQVPAGVYSADGFATFYIDQQQQFVDLLSPQITVAGDTGFTLDVDTAQRITISTPRPSQAFNGGVFGDYRGTPDGAWESNTTAVLGIPPYLWVTPTAPVTIGTFHLVSELILGQPLLTMTVTAPDHLNLNALYWTYEEYPTAGSNGAVRFPGRQTLQLVDAGYGRPQDFAGIDARGKLALIRIAPAGPWGVSGGSCSPPGSLGSLEDWQLANAIQAGAAGVLVDSSDPAQDPNGWCTLPVYPSSQAEQIAPPNIPFASIPVDEANTLIGLLAHHTVKIDIASYRGNSPYVYTPQLYREGQVPASLHTTLTGSQLASLTDNYHSSEPAAVTECWSAWRPDEFFVIGMCYGDFAAPGGFQEYRGPLAPDTVQLRLDIFPFPQGQQIFDVVNQTGGTEDWAAVPATPGATTISTDVLQAQPGKWSNQVQNLSFCAFCRQGDTFYPIMDLISGADPRLGQGLFGFDVESIHLYQGGNEIPPTPILGGIASYQMPAGQARYHLVTQFNSTSTTWDFTSSRPSIDRTPAGTGCVGTFFGSADPCAPEPLILLRYNAHTDLTDTLTAPGAQRLDVTAYGQAPDAPPVTSLSLSISTDGGATWRQLHVTDLGGGNFTAEYSLPALSQTSGTLSIKARAQDAAGNDISQTILDAVKLAAPAPRG